MPDIRKDRRGSNPDSPSSDAFGRNRVSEPTTIFDSAQIYDKSPHVWSETVSGNALSQHNAGHSSVLMTVSGTNDKVVRQTKMRFHYQPGKSQLVFLTGQTYPVAGVRGRMGYFDGSDGVFIEFSGTNVTWNVMKAGAITETVAQTEWNMNRLANLQPSGCQIAVIDMEWLGVGRVRCGFNIEGATVYCHEFDHSNNGFTEVYTKTANLPIRYELESFGGETTMQHICSSVVSEGGSQEIGEIHTADTGVATVSADSSNETVLLAIRLKSGHEYTTVIPLLMHALTTTASANGRWTLRLNPILASGSFGAWTAAHPNSSVEYQIGNGAQFVVSGVHIQSGYFSNTSRGDARALNSALRLGMDLAGTRDVMTLAVQGFTGTPSFAGSLTWRELK